MLCRARVTKARQVDKPKIIIDEKKIERSRPSRRSGRPGQAADAQQGIDKTGLADV